MVLFSKFEDVCGKDSQVFGVCRCGQVKVSVGVGERAKAGGRVRRLLAKGSGKPGKGLPPPNMRKVFPVRP